MVIDIKFGVTHKDGQIKEYQPFRAQALFHDSDAKYKFLSGAFRASKTFPLCVEVALLCTSFEGNRGVLARDTFPQLRDTTMYSFLHELKVWNGERWVDMVDSPLCAKFNKTDKIFTFPNKSQILFRHFSGHSKEDEGADWKSMTLGFVAIDEGTECRDNIFQTAQSRLVQPGIPYRPLLSASNPGPKSHWLYRHFIEEEGVDPEYFIGWARMEDNTELPDGYIESLRKSYSPEFARRYLDGEWGSFEGAIYPTFDEKVHGLDRIEVIDGEIHCWNGTNYWKVPLWGMYRGIDFGSIHPFVCLWGALGTNGKWYFVDEWYKPGGVIREHKTAIHSRNYGDTFATYSDHDHQLRSEFETDSYGGPIYTIKAKKDVHPGIQAVTVALSRQADGAPGLYYNKSKVYYLPIQMNSYRWHPEKDEPVKKDDDTPDVARYIIYTTKCNLMYPKLMTPEEVYEARVKKKYWDKKKKRGGAGRYAPINHKANCLF